MLDDPTLRNFREADAADIDRLVALGAQFFAESDFGAFTEFAPENFRLTMESLIGREDCELLVFLPDGEVIEGFIAFNYDVSYTKDPLALLFLLYVSPAFRRSPAGRFLVDLALVTARISGAKAFYAGAMSGVPGTEKTLGNMLRKLGFEDVDFWGRALL